EGRRRVTLISTKSDEYEGHATFPFMRDGGQPSKKAAGKALYVHKQLLSRLHLQAGQYEPTFQRGRAEPRVSIDLEPVAASYDAPEKVPSRVGGVYRILDEGWH